MRNYDNIKNKGIDPIFASVVAILLIFGLFVLSSASLPFGEKKFDNPTYFLRDQLLKGVLLGLIGFFLALKIPYETLKKYSFIFLIVSIGMLALVFFPKIGFSWGGARRWINFGPIIFQPSEIVKLTFLIYLAAWFDARKKDIQSIASGLIPFLIIIGIIGALLLMQPDMGTFGVIALSGLAVYWAAGAKRSHIFFITVLGLIGFFLLAWIAPYRWNRIMVFTNSSIDPQGIGYHLNQAVTSVAIGGLTGVGIGQAQTSAYLPEAAGDSIFAVLSEELGLLGASVALFLYFAFAARGYQIARHLPDGFLQFLVVGVISWIMIQSFVNIAAMTGSFILTGIPLPFISYGGTALTVTLTASGVVANISRYRTA